jgi:hypothetical protein
VELMVFQMNTSDTLNPHFPTSWKEAKVVTLPKPGQDPKFPQNLHLISLLSSTSNVFEKVVLEIVERHIGERNLLNPFASNDELWSHERYQ